MLTDVLKTSVKNTGKKVGIIFFQDKVLSYCNCRLPQKTSNLYLSTSFCRYLTQACHHKRKIPSLKYTTTKLLKNYCTLKSSFSKK